MNESTVPTETQTIVGKAEVMPSVPTAQSIMPVATDPGSMLAALVSQGADMSVLEKFMDLKERHEKNEARKAYVVAMAKFKANPPVIIKDRQVCYENKDKSVTTYNHASLGAVTNLINAEMSKYGLFASWTTEQAERVSVTCTISHELGHSESVTMISSLDQTGGKNNIQALGSVVSYLQRYTLLSATGLAAQEMDDDGKGASPPVELISEAQLINLAEICESKGYDAENKLAGLAKVWKLAKISDMPAAWFEKAQVRLNNLPNNEAAE